MLTIPQPSPATLDGIEVVDVTDPPQALGLVLRFVYPSPSLPAIEDLTVLSEALVIADKYDIEVARVRLRSSFAEFAKTEPLRAYAVACRLGLTDEMKTASSHTTHIHLPGLAQLPDEFKLIPATEYHRLILLHSKYRKEVEMIAGGTPFPKPVLAGVLDLFASMSAGEDQAGRMKAREAAREHFRSIVSEGVPLSPGSLVRALRMDHTTAASITHADIHTHITSILSRANDLNLTV